MNWVINDSEQDDVVADLNFGDTSQTAKKVIQCDSVFWSLFPTGLVFFLLQFFAKHGKPHTMSALTLKEVDAFLDEMAGLTKEDDHVKLWSRFMKAATPDDLKWFVRIVEHDLKINVGSKFVLNALHPSGYDGTRDSLLCPSCIVMPSLRIAYRKTNNLKMIVQRVLENKAASITKTFSGAAKLKMTAALSLMTPVKPMLAKYAIFLLFFEPMLIANSFCVCLSVCFPCC